MIVCVNQSTATIYIRLSQRAAESRQKLSGFVGVRMGDGGGTGYVKVKWEGDLGGVQRVW